MYSEDWEQLVWGKRLSFGVNWTHIHILVLALTSWVTFKINVTSLKILKEMGIRDHLTCLLRNLYAGQEATVRTGHGTAD